MGLLGCLITLPLLLGGWLWLRHSSLVAVRHVQVTGAQGPDAQAIESALVGAARHMSTLDVHPAALRAAVAPFPIVRGLQVNTDFPHGLRIRVIEQPPVAALVAAGARNAVAADGMVLGPALLSASLPTLPGGAVPPAGEQGSARERPPASEGPSSGERSPSGESSPSGERGPSGESSPSGERSPSGESSPSG